MSFPTRSELVTAVITELGLVPGTDVQLFTEPQIEAKIKPAFDTLADKRFWPHLTTNTIHELDGVVGVITDTLTYVATVDDIEWIREYPYEPYNKLTYLNGQPYTYQTQPAYDTLPWNHAQYATKLVQIYPVDSTNPIMIRARRKPIEFNADNSVIPFDKVALVHYLSFLLFSTDGINAEAAGTQLGLFEQRYEDLIGNNSNEPLVYGTNRSRNSFTVAE